VGVGVKLPGRVVFLLLGTLYKAVHRTRLDAQCCAKRVLMVSIFLAYHFVPRVSHLPFMDQKPFFWGAPPA